VFAEIEQTKKCFRTLETLGKPVVSLPERHGAGRRLGVALVGHYRVGRRQPEDPVRPAGDHLGLIPGASGITKMTRLLGLMGAQPYVMESKLFSPREALELGLVHETGARCGKPCGRPPWPSSPPIRRRTTLGRQELQDAGRHARQPEDRRHAGGRARVLQAEDPRPLPGPDSALAAMVEGAQVDFDTALRIESRYLAKLIVSPVAKNMINTFFFNMNAIKSGQSRPNAGRQLQAAEGRHPGRRHDGRGHRLRAGQPRRRHRAQGRVAWTRRGRQGLHARRSPSRASTRAA
jgi:3-hydroxyacyl-CoA dehydrogenase/enoyl-CoA hydratase/3-hydroxybutyryl-CoA epimerase